MRGAFHTELDHLTFHHTGAHGAARERSRRPLCTARGRSRARPCRSQNEHFAVLANRAGKAHSVGVEATVTGDLVHEGPDRVVSAHLRSPAQGSLRQLDWVMAVKRTNASPRHSGRHALFRKHDRKGRAGTQIASPEASDSWTTEDTGSFKLWRLRLRGNRYCGPRARWVSPQVPQTCPTSARQPVSAMDDVTRLDVRTSRLQVILRVAPLEN